MVQVESERIRVGIADDYFDVVVVAAHRRLAV